MSKHRRPDMLDWMIYSDMRPRPPWEPWYWLAVCVAMVVLMVLLGWFDKVAR